MKRAAAAAAVAAAIAVGAGSGTTLALWRVSDSSAATVDVAVNSMDVTVDGQTARQSGHDSPAELQLGGPDAAADLARDGSITYLVTERWSSTGNSQVTAHLNLSDPGPGVFGSADRAVWDVTSDPSRCTVANWPEFSQPSAWTVDNGDEPRGTEVHTRRLCVGFRLSATGEYTNVGSVAGVADDGSTVAAQDTWTVATVPDPAAERTFTLSASLTTEAVC